jgi:hypothetical protein
MNSSITLTGLAAVFTQTASTTNFDDESGVIEVRASEAAPNQPGKICWFLNFLASVFYF